MADTPNHAYKRPAKGDPNWDVPLNSNFEALDTDIEIRDSGGPKAGTNDYTPAQGAKYLDTDAGLVYEGDGSTWQPTLAVARWQPDTNIGGSVLLGDVSNQVEAGQSTIAGGTGNTVYDNYGTISGGSSNQAGSDDGDPTTDTHATVGGGFGNVAKEFYTSISGGRNNTASGFQATVGGGGSFSDFYSTTIVSFAGNEASGIRSVVCGGGGNAATGAGATVAGGTGYSYYDSVTGTAIKVPGNTASGKRAFVGGGADNTAIAVEATVGGGNGNTASGVNATVVGGSNNNADANFASVGGGRQNLIQAYSATVPGGSDCYVDGDYSFATGRKAESNANAGTFVFGDSSSTTVQASAADQVVFQAGGTRTSGTAVEFYSQSDGSAGVKLAANDGTWASLSTRAAKTDVEPVAEPEVLNAVEQLDVSTWRYNGQEESVRHMGPMAEEFHEEFGLGTDEETIAALDLAGVSLAAIQGLSKRLDEQSTELDQTRDELREKHNRIEQLEQEKEELEDRLETIENQLQIDPTENSADQHSAED